MTAVTLAQGEHVDCPDCSGQGMQFIPNFGRRAVDPFIEIPCNPCEGTGLVDAERVTVCGICGDGTWVGENCPKPECRAAVQDDLAFEAFRELELIRRELVR